MGAREILCCNEDGARRRDDVGRVSETIEFSLQEIGTRREILQEENLLQYEQEMAKDTMLFKLRHTNLVDVARWRGLV